MGDSLDVGDFLVLIQQRVQGPLGLEVLESSESEALRWTVRTDI